MAIKKDKQIKLRLTRLKRMQKEKEVVCEISKGYKCNKCNNEKFYVFYIEANNGFGLYCKSCGTHIKFLNATERKSHNIHSKSQNCTLICE